MKKIYYATLLLLASIMNTNAQTPCDAGRYSTDVFPTVTVTANINYGANLSWTGANTPLNLNLYEPTGDTASARPLIIWAHGGSFVGGSKTDQDVVSLSNAFAKKGFVCASIDYRTGMWPIDSVNSVKAVIRAVQDMRASVRFFYRDRAEGNVYNIDTNNIFIGGSSAGAVTSLHLAYLDSTCEVNTYITPVDLNALGGIEGSSGNKCYSSNVNGVINLCGALASYGWMDLGDTPLCSLHGNNDGTVPYNRGQAYVVGNPIMYLDGSRMLYEHTQAIGLQHNFYSYYGAGHVPYAGTGAVALAYMDTTVNFIRDFLIDRLTCTDPALQPANAPLETSNLYTYTPCSGHVPLIVDCSDVGVEDLESEIGVNIYPNPASDELNISVSEGEIIRKIELSDLSGRLIRTIDVETSHVSIKKENLFSGTYIFRITTSEGKTVTRNVVFQ